MYSPSNFTFKPFDKSHLKKKKNKFPQKQLGIKKKKISL